MAGIRSTTMRRFEVACETAQMEPENERPRRRRRKSQRSKPKRNKTNRVPREIAVGGWPFQAPLMIAICFPLTILGGAWINGSEVAFGLQVTLLVFFGVAGLLGACSTSRKMHISTDQPEIVVTQYLYWLPVSTQELKFRDFKAGKIKEDLDLLGCFFYSAIVGSVAMVGAVIGLALIVVLLFPFLAAGGYLGRAILASPFAAKDAYDEFGGSDATYSDEKQIFSITLTGRNDVTLARRRSRQQITAIKRVLESHTELQVGDLPPGFNR